jgi:FlaG/FlaF family flagellin (archaellin)
MVAITVILAAVIAAFVFGMAGNIQKTKVIAATAQKPDATHISVTYQGGQDAGTVMKVIWTFIPVTGTPVNYDMNNYATNSILTVGSSKTIKSDDFSGKVHVVATALFTDGTQQVILDNTI